MYAHRIVTAAHLSSSNPGDVVLGKIKGYPPWPGIVSVLCSTHSHSLTFASADCA